MDRASAQTKGFPERVKDPMAPRAGSVMNNHNASQSMMESSFHGMGGDSKHKSSMASTAFMFNKNLAQKTPLKDAKPSNIFKSGYQSKMRKTAAVGFAFQSGRVSTDLMEEFVQPGPTGFKSVEQRQKIITQALKLRKRRQINVSQGIVDEGQIDPQLYRKITNAHREMNSDLDHVQVAKRRTTVDFAFNQKDLNESRLEAIELQLHNQSFIKSQKPHPEMTSTRFSSPRGKSVMRSTFRDQGLFDRTSALDFATEKYEIQTEARNNKIHPLRIELNNLDVEHTLDEEVIMNLYAARCLDNKVDQNETQKKNFLATCREHSIEGRLILQDMQLGYKCSEVLCSILMDKSFYISHLDLRKNPLGDDGVIVLMHAIKRCNTIVYLDLSSVHMTQKGAIRVLKAISSNESVQHLVLSNAEGQLKNALGWQFLEYLEPLFQKNCFIQYLDFSNNRFQDQGFKLIARALQKNATLLYLNLENCDLTSASAKDMQRCFSSMKVLADLNLSRNNLGAQGGMALAEALISNQNSVIWRLNVSRCCIDPEGTRHFFNAMRQNKKLVQLIYDYNRFEPEVERLSPVLSEFFMTNKTLLNLSLEGCEINRSKFDILLQCLSMNQTLLTLKLSNNELDRDDMFRFKTVFDDKLKTLSLKHLDLSSNRIDDDGGCLLIQGVYYQDCIETLNLKNNIVKDQTAQAIATYVSKRGIRLRNVDLSMNRGIPQKFLMEIAISIQRNSERAQRMKDYFMSLFKKICHKQDMKEDYIDAIIKRKVAIQLLNLEKTNVIELTEDISQTKVQILEEETECQDNKRALKDFSFKMDIELGELDPIASQKEKALSQELEKHQKRADDIVSEREKVENLIAETERAIMVHPKSKKKEIIGLRKQLQEFKEKIASQETFMKDLQKEVEDQRLLSKASKKEKKGKKDRARPANAGGDKQINNDIKFDDTQDTANNN